MMTVANTANTTSTMVGGGTKAYSSYRAGKYNSATAKLNAQLADIQAEQEIQSGHFNEQVLAKNTSEAEGEVIASAAGQGVVAGAGSSGRAIYDIEALSAMDRLMIQTNARRRAYGYKVDAADSRSRAKMARYEGNNAAIASLLDTGARLELAQARRAREDQ